MIIGSRVPTRSGNNSANQAVPDSCSPFEGVGGGGDGKNSDGMEIHVTVMKLAYRKVARVGGKTLPLP